MKRAFDMPYPPSANRLWRAVPGKGVLKSGHYRAWLAEALALLRAQRPGLVPGSYRLTIIATRPDLRARDLDNLAKPISDALKQAGVIEDDSKAASILLQWSESLPVKGGQIRIVVEAAERPSAEAVVTTLNAIDRVKSA
jgi:Holliday junction resolvase RusA-like endonuclease